MTSPTQRRTYSREAWEQAQAAWRDGHYSPEWKEWRHLAAMEAGIIFPPEGSEWDSWTDDQPSERAILIRAIRETPAALRSALRSPRVHSWAAVVAVLVRGRDERARDIEQEQRYLPTYGSPEGDAAALRDILRRLA